MLPDEIPETSSRVIELADKRQIKKSSKTLLLDAVALMDLQIICISSVGCDLRFYDISSASKFNLRLYIRSFPSPLTAFHYHCPADGDDKKSKLIFGDMAGTVRVIYFTENFKSKFCEGSVIRQYSFHELMKVIKMGVDEMCIKFHAYHSVPLLLGRTWDNNLWRVHQDSPWCDQTSVVYQQHEQFYLCIWKCRHQKLLSSKCHNCGTR